MSLINVACGPHRMPRVIGRSKRAAIAGDRSRDWLGTFWAHLVSTEVNSGESHYVSFRSSVPVRLGDQHPETGSIPGSSTGKTLVRAISSGQFSFFAKANNRHSAAGLPSATDGAPAWNGV